MKRLWLFVTLWFVVGLGWQALLNVVVRRATTPSAVAVPGAGLPLGPQHSERVVVVVLSGVGSGALHDPANPWAFRTLRRLAAEGAWGVADVALPSGDGPTWAALLSGAAPRHSGIVNDQQGATPPDHLFRQAERRGLRAIIVGSAVALPRRAGALPALAAASSNEVGAVAAQALRAEPPPQLAVVVLDLARRQQFRGSALNEQLDAQLAAIVNTLNPTRDTLVVTADHGLLPDGGFGGNERAVGEVPLVMWGAHVASGPLGRVSQRSIAPTVAVLLGLPLPAINGGRPLVEALTLDAPAQAEALYGWAVQRHALAFPDAAQGYAPPAFIAAQQARASGDAQATIRAADAVVAALDAPAARDTAFDATYVWSVGVPLALFAIAWVLGRQGRRWAAWLALPALGAELYLLGWALLFFVLGGGTMSLSWLYPNLSSALVSVSVWAALALVIAALPLAWLAVGWGGRVAVADLLRLGLVLNLLGAALVAALWLSGTTLLAAPGAWTVLVLVLAQLAGLSLVAPLAALLVAALADILERGR